MSEINGRDPIDCLPPEIFDEVLLVVPDCETLQACTLVNRRWDHAASPHLFANFNGKSDPYPHAECFHSFVKKLRASPRISSAIKELRLSTGDPPDHWTQVMEARSRSFRSNNPVTRLKVSEFPTKCILHRKQLFDILQVLPRLHTLRLHWLNLSDDEYFDEAILPYGFSLKKLHLSQVDFFRACDKQKPYCVTSLTRNLSLFTKIDDLSIESCASNVPDLVDDAHTSTYKTPPRCSTLKIRELGPPSRYVLRFFDHPEASKFIRVLDISPLRQMDCQSFSNLISHAPLLENLTLGVRAIGGDSDTDVILKAADCNFPELMSCTNLKKIQLNINLQTRFDVNPSSSFDIISTILTQLVDHPSLHTIIITVAYFEPTPTLVNNTMLAYWHSLDQLITSSPNFPVLQSVEIHFVTHKRGLSQCCDRPTRKAWLQKMGTAFPISMARARRSGGQRESNIKVTLALKRSVVCEHDPDSTNTEGVELREIMNM